MGRVVGENIVDSLLSNRGRNSSKGSTRCGEGRCRGKSRSDAKELHFNQRVSVDGSSRSFDVCDLSRTWGGREPNPFFHFRAQRRLSRETSQRTKTDVPYVERRSTLREKQDITCVRVRPHILVRSYVFSFGLPSRC